MWRLLPPLLFIVACGQPDTDTSSTADPSIAAATRIVSLSGTLTELLYDLGYGDRMVGVDVTSVYPAATDSLAKLGHVSQLNVEALLALRPDLVFVDADAADRPALETLRTAGVQVIAIAMQPTLDNALHATAALAEYLEVPTQTTTDLKRRIERDREALAATLATSSEKPRVLFIYARGAGNLMVAGTDTEAAAMIQLAGGENAITSFADFKPLTPEALVEAAPDVLLLFSSGLASLDGREGLQNIPGIAQTPAYRNDRIVAMDGHYLLGFGPRAAAAAGELAAHLHPTASK